MGVAIAIGWLRDDKRSPAALIHSQAGIQCIQATGTDHPAGAGIHDPQLSGLPGHRDRSVDDEDPPCPLGNGHIDGGRQRRGERPSPQSPLGVHHGDEATHCRPVTLDKRRDDGPPGVAIQDQDGLRIELHVEQDRPRQGDRVQQRRRASREHADAGGATPATECDEIAVWLVDRERGRALGTGGHDGVQGRRRGSRVSRCSTDVLG